MIADKKPEQKYIFAVDQTINKSMKNLIYSIAKGVGLGKTCSILKEDIDVKDVKFSPQDFYIDPNKFDKSKLNQCITDNELNWKLQLNLDVMLTNSKFIEEDWEWHCKEGIPGNIKKLLDEFCKMRKLRPIKIILNSNDKYIRCVFAEKLAHFFNIPVINYDLILSKLSIEEENLSEEEKIINEKYLYLKKRLNSLDPNDSNETNELLMNPTEIIFEALKNILQENVCQNTGYVLEGLPINMEEINMLYYYKQEIIEEENQDEDTTDKPEEEGEGEIKQDKKKKIQRKKYKSIFEKSLLPESIISISEGTIRLHNLI